MQFFHRTRNEVQRAEPWSSPRRLIAIPKGTLPTVLRVLVKELEFCVSTSLKH